MGWSRAENALGGGAERDGIVREYNIAPMLIVALETVTPRGSLALWEDGRVVSFESDDARTHAERLPGELMNWLGREGRALADVDLFAVISGPGSFTGLRVGIAAVQGLAFAGDRRVVPIPTLDALALTIQPTEPGMTIAPCLDGQRGEVFMTAFEQTEERDPRHWRVVVESTAGRPEVLASTLACQTPGRPIYIGGSGADRYRLSLPRLYRTCGWSPRTPPWRKPPCDWQQSGRRKRSHLMRFGRSTCDALTPRWRGTEPVWRPCPRPQRFARGVRNLTRDLEPVEALQRQTFTNPWGADAIRWELENSDVARLYVLEASGGALVAYCACWMIFDELHINSLAVDHAWRRHGAARTLLAHVLSDAARAGATGATLEVRRSNEPACALLPGARV